MSPRLVQDWRSAPRWFSVQAMSLALAIQGTWLALPDDLRSGIPDGWSHIVTAVLLACGLIGRLAPQSTPNDEPGK